VGLAINLYRKSLHTIYIYWLLPIPILDQYPDKYYIHIGHWAYVLYLYIFCK